MKHLKVMTQKPAQAQDATVGTILSVVAQILSVVGAALVAKESAG